jgi:hypothetical protein
MPTTKRKTGTKTNRSRAGTKKKIWAMADYAEAFRGSLLRTGNLVFF